MLFLCEVLWFCLIILLLVFSIIVFIGIFCCLVVCWVRVRVLFIVVCSGLVGRLRDLWVFIVYSGGCIFIYCIVLCLLVSRGI